MELNRFLHSQPFPRPSLESREGSRNYFINITGSKSEIDYRDLSSEVLPLNQGEDLGGVDTNGNRLLN